LEHVKLIRWSSTITSNVLGERRGSKVGLLVTAGHERNLYANGRSFAIDEIVAEHNVVGLSKTAYAHEVLGVVKKLFEDGVRRICVSLQGAFPDNSAEIRVKQIIEDSYPDHYLGAVPVLLGSEMAQVLDDATRTHYSLINAYVHSQLAGSLFKAEDILKHELKWDGPLLVGHANGGVARIGKTKAVDTIESGPVFGMFGGAYMARQYKLDNVLCLDVGGTTAKASVIKNGKPLYRRGGEIIGIPVQTSFALLRTAVVGGGSIARPADDGSIELGPESMGASPGPACYGLGGGEATLTDALLLLGYLDPGNFLGGRRALDVDAATQAIQEKLAMPMRITVERAAGLIRDEAVGIIANLVKTTLAEAGLSAAQTALFAFGGNGPLFGALVASRLNIPHVHVFNLGPIFSAFGSAISDVVHVYERAVGDTKVDDVGVETIVSAVTGLLAQATRDLDAEGFLIAQSRFSVELETVNGTGQLAMINLTDISDINKRLIDGALHSTDPAERPVLVILVRLIARYPVGSFELTKVRPADAGAPRRVAQREILVGLEPTLAAIYAWPDLPLGAPVAGPTVVAGPTLTCLVPPGWQLAMDEFGTGTLSRQTAAGARSPRSKARETMHGL
jgi:N-methylhydantoinase A/oxoprolinase/acetone carboxylase beta subunit